MNIIVLSDTHGNYPAAIRAVEQAPEIDRIIHLGDFCDDALPLHALLTCPVIRVPGNCDIDSHLPRELFIHLGDVPFLLCHGDAYGVKGGLSRLAERAGQLGAKVVLFGHTHTPLIRYHDDMLFVNPGALQKSTSTPTFALVTLNDGNASARIISLPTPPVS